MEKEKMWKPVKGEVVLAELSYNWDSRIFLAEVEGAEFPYVCVSPKDETLYKEGKTFRTVAYRKITKMPPLGIVDGHIERINQVLDRKVDDLHFFSLLENNKNNKKWLYKQVIVKAELITGCFYLNKEARSESLATHLIELVFLCSQIFRGEESEEEIEMSNKEYQKYD